jgi:tetratricopeptide (TPR) repeat protein
MNRIAVVCLLLCVATAHAQEYDQRKPSTPEERARFVQVVESLQKDPFASDAKDKRTAALQWLIAVPDISITICDMPPGLLGSKSEMAKEILFQASLSSAAFIIKYPAFKDDLYYVDLAGIDGLLKTYQAARAVKPNSKIPELEPLVSQRLSGDLLQTVAEYTKKCHPGFKTGPAAVEGDSRAKIGQTHHQRGNAFFDNHYFLHALAEYKVLLELFPNSSTSFLEAGQTYYRLGNFSKGEELIKNSIKADPACVVCLIGLANLVDDAGRPGEALMYYQKASEIDPQNATLHFNIGLTLTRLRRYPESEAAVQKALSISPTYASPYLTLAQAKREQKQLYAAEAAYKSFLNLEKEGSRAERVTELLRAKVLVDPTLKGAIAFDAYAQYGLARAEWIRSKFRRIYPEKEQYVKTVEEEADALTQQASKWREIRKNNAKAFDAELDRLLAIDDAGHLSHLAALTVEAYTDTQTRLAFEKWCTDTGTSCKPITQRVTVEWMSQKF